MDRKDHWENVYRTRAVTEVSWYQGEAGVSLDLIARVADPRVSVVVDVGGGASTLVDGLVRRGFGRVTVLDIVPAALDVARARLGEAACRVAWMVADVLTYPFPLHSVDVWHDRAVFHFLTSPEDRQAYVEQVRRAVRPNGHVIVATFAADGPMRCSGLDVRRYGAEELRGEFGQGFELLDQIREDHTTPAGAVQRFQYCLCAHRPAQQQAA